jgi:beta-galactosidase
VFSENIPCSSISPGKVGNVSLPKVTKPANGIQGRVLTISIRAKNISVWADAGHEVAWFQHALKLDQVQSIPTKIQGPPSELRLIDSKATYKIEGNDFTFNFDKAFGTLTEWVASGHSIISSPPLITVWRAPTDNDLAGSAGKWDEFFLSDMRQAVRSIRLVPFTQGSLQIVVDAYISSPVRVWGFATTITYTFWPNGAVQISYHLKPQNYHPPLLPRMGVEMWLHKEFTTVKWFGRGPEESYADKKDSQKIGIYTQETNSLHTPYEVPQENGNRADTRWMVIANQQGTLGIKTTRTGKYGGTVFDFAAQHYTAMDLATANHPCELIRRDEVMLRLDAEHSGVGTAACGPGVLDAYEVRCKEFEFGFILEPILNLN